MNLIFNFISFFDTMKIGAMRRSLWLIIGWKMRCEHDKIKL